MLPKTRQRNYLLKLNNTTTTYFNLTNNPLSAGIYSVQNII